MLKKCLYLITILVLFIFVVGCGGAGKPGPSPENTGTAGNKTPGNSQGSEITVGYIASGTSSPQALVNIKSPVFNEQFQALGKKVKFTSTRSLDNIWPMMDREKGSLDFVYIPAANYATYVTGTSKFGGSTKYTIVAGSLNYNGTVLIVRPGINSLKDLAGKKVGIANLRYLDEFQLDKVLGTVGLHTVTNGGNVQVFWDDIVSQTAESFGKGKYDAVCMYGAENFEPTMAKVPGSKVLTELNPNGLFGEKAPRYWLAVKKDIIKNNPEILKAALKAHVLSTDKAQAQVSELPALNRQVFLDYFKGRAKDMDRIIKKNTLESYQKRWQEVQITYDPGVSFATDVFRFMDKKGLVKGQTVNDFIDIRYLNEILQQMGKPAVQ